MIKPFKSFSSLKKENAQTMVEFALVFPLILLITYGIIEFGRMLFMYTEVTAAAREGARYGAAMGMVSGVPQYANCGGIAAAARSKTILTTISTVTITYDNGPGTGPFYTCATVSANPSLINIGYRVKVSASGVFTPMISFLGIKQFTINSYNARTIIMNVEIKGTPYP